MTDLRLDWCSHDAAKYAVQNWHYSGTMPFGKTAKVGVWENDTFKGVVIYARGASKHIGDPFNMDMTEVCELQRMALDDHATPTSRIISISLKLLQERSPELRLVVSFADPEQGHDGTVYQASNWLYLGTNNTKPKFNIGGEIRHSRSVGKEYGTMGIENLREMLPDDTTVEFVDVADKHKYVYPLDDDARELVESMSELYPDEA